MVTDISTDYSGDILWADKKLGGEIEFLKSLNVPFHIDTNGVCLDRERGVSLLDSRLESLNISLDATTTQTYQRVRRGAPRLESVLDNIGAFVKLRATTKGADRISVSMSFTLMRSTLHELDRFIELAAEVGLLKVYGRHLEAYTESMGPESLVFDHTALTKAIESAQVTARKRGLEFLTADLPGSYGKSGHQRCQVATNTAVILGNGDVAVCCVPRMTIGTLHDSSMEAIWNGRHYQEFRRRLNSDNPPPQCAACPMMRSWNNVHSFLPFLTMKDWQHPQYWTF